MRHVDLCKILNEKYGPVHYKYLNNVLMHRVRPSLKLAIAIERYSKGEWKASELRPDIKGLAQLLKRERAAV